MKLKLLDLFSGIGGFSLGLESTGYFETIAFVEKDKFCQQVLKKNFKDIPIESEVRDVKGDRYAADIVCGGFPCQPFSVAGKRKGTDDDRYLWDETIRIIRECKPRWFIGENVEGIINIQKGVVLRQVCDDLEREGFQVQCLVIPASGIGAWHQRKRIWIIGCNISNSISELSDGCSSSTRDSSTEQQRLVSNKSKDRNKIRSKAKRCSEQTKSWWQTQSELCGVPNGISTELDKDRANRIKSLGNSIVPEIAREIGQSILIAEDVSNTDSNGHSR